MKWVPKALLRVEAVPEIRGRQTVGKTQATHMISNLSDVCTGDGDLGERLRCHWGVTVHLSGLVLILERVGIIGDVPKRAARAWTIVFNQV